MHTRQHDAGLEEIGETTAAVQMSEAGAQAQAAADCSSSAHRPLVARVSVLQCQQSVITQRTALATPACCVRDA